MVEARQQEARQDSEQDLPALTSPGEILVEGREAVDMSRARVAAELGLTETAVREIEENHFEKFAAGIYVRGYLKNYARLLGLNEQQLLTSYDQYRLVSGFAEDKECVSGGPMMTANHRRVLVGCTVALVAIAMVSLLIWLANL